MIHREQRMKNNSMFAKIIIYRLIRVKNDLDFQKDKSIQEDIKTNNKIPKTIFDKVF